MVDSVWYNRIKNVEGGIGPSYPPPPLPRDPTNSFSDVKIYVTGNPSRTTINKHQ